MDEPPVEPDAPLVRYLKTLVTVLTVTMIAAVLVLVAAVVMRLRADTAPPFPAEIALPEGATASAITRGPGWLAVVTTDGRILVMSPDGQTITREVDVGK